jgi:RNA recognition motif-containing protein
LPQPDLDQPGRWLIRQYHQSLNNRAQANEDYKQLEQVRQSAVSGELVNRPKANRADDHDDQNPD